MRSRALRKICNTSLPKLLPSKGIALLLAVEKKHRAHDGTAGTIATSQCHGVGMVTLLGIQRTGGSFECTRFRCQSFTLGVRNTGGLLSRVLLRMHSSAISLVNL